MEAKLWPLMPGFGGAEDIPLSEVMERIPQTALVECEPVEEVDGVRFWRTEAGDLVADLRLSPEEAKAGFSRVLRLGGAQIRAEREGALDSDELVQAGSAGGLKLFVRGVRRVSGGSDSAGSRA